MHLYPQIKVCGLTIPEEAVACARLGADAIGLVFYPPSPRYLELERAAEITAALPPAVAAVGVFVDPDWRFLSSVIDRCKLGVVQLHGNETPELARRIRDEWGVKVVKALFTAKAPGLDLAKDFSVAAYLVECGKGPLPGGNAEAWNWAAAADFARRYPTALAGGLAPDNVARAVAAALPAAVDASSGLESKPGRKDLTKVADFIRAVRGISPLYEASGLQPRPVF